MVLNISFWYHDPIQLNKPYGQKTLYFLYDDINCKKQLTISYGQKTLYFLYDDINCKKQKEFQEFETKKKSKFRKKINMFSRL